MEKDENGHEHRVKINEWKKWLIFWRTWVFVLKNRLFNTTTKLFEVLGQIPQNFSKSEENSGNGNWLLQSKNSAFGVSEPPQVERPKKDILGDETHGFWWIGRFEDLRTTKSPDMVGYGAVLGEIPTLLWSKVANFHPLGAKIDFSSGCLVIFWPYLASQATWARKYNPRELNHFSFALLLWHFLRFFVQLPQKLVHSVDLCTQNTNLLQWLNFERSVVQSPGSEEK